MRLLALVAVFFAAVCFVAATTRLSHEGVTAVDGRGTPMHVAWPRLVEVGILTTSEARFVCWTGRPGDGRVAAETPPNAALPSG